MEKCLCLKTVEGAFVEGANYKCDYDKNRSKAKRYFVYRVDDTIAEMSEAQFKKGFTTDFII